MKKIVVIFALALLLKPLIPFVDYMVNYDYISKVLCVNKEKPALKCNGKCHLMKELAKASEDEKPLNSDKKSNAKQEIEVLFFEAITYPSFVNYFGRNKSSIFANYLDGYAYLMSSSFFHPPSIIS